MLANVVDEIERQNAFVTTRATQYPDKEENGYPGALSLFSFGRLLAYKKNSAVDAQLHVNEKTS